MSEQEAATFVQNRCVFEGDAETRRQTWEEARGRVLALPPLAVRAPSFRELPAEVQDPAGAFLRSAEGARLFPPGTMYQLVGVDGLMTYQFHVDSEYVDEVGRDAPALGEWNDILTFCTRRCPLADPFIDKGSATFGSHHAGNPTLEPLVVARRVSETEVEVCARVISRPNYVLVYRYADGRAVLANGNHRVAALVRGGHREIPAVVQQVPFGASIHQMNVAVEGNFIEPMLLTSPRPPVVADYVDAGASTELRLRALNSVLRVGLQGIGFAAPR
jgi:hypothetical protein